MTLYILKMSHFVWQWIDFIWLPLSLLLVHKSQRLMTAGFVLACLLTLRLQVEIMKSVGAFHGFFNLLGWDALKRGQLTYSLMLALFCVLAHYSPKTPAVIFLAVVLSLYILTACVAMLIMAL